MLRVLGRTRRKAVQVSHVLLRVKEDRGRPCQAALADVFVDHRLMDRNQFSLLRVCVFFPGDEFSARWYI